jgi:hypothetical protein
MTGAHGHIGRLLARWLIVTGRLNTAFVLFFLQLELMLEYARG